jgi:hypothetical protein
LDITGAYDNVLIDILCRELKKEGFPVPLVFFLWDMMCEKRLYFFDGQTPGCLHTLCSILQYADDLVVYISGRHVEAVRDCLQTSLTRLMTWFGDLGLSLFFSGNMKIPRFRCGSVRLHFEMNLNIWK